MNNTNEILSKVIKIVDENIENGNIEIDQLDADLSELGMDSIAFACIIVALEETFSIEIPDEYLLIAKLNTVKKMIDVILSIIENHECEMV